MLFYRDALRSHQDVINRMNVFPVPDGDTGTNMMRTTVDSVVDELETVGPDADMAEVCRAVAHGSLMGAAGTSGVILSQLLRGMTTVGGGHRPADPRRWRKPWSRPPHWPAQAVVRPVEGTILTVAHAAGDGAAAGRRPAPTCAARSRRPRRGGPARSSGRRPPAALAQAGVVDAGGAGYVLLFDALLAALDGRPLPEPHADPRRSCCRLGAPALGSEGSDGEERTTGLRYEVMYFLHAPDDTIPDFKEVWAGIGDSIVVVGGDGTWNCHIHTDDIGAAIEAAIDCGRPWNIRVTDLTEQVEEERSVARAPPNRQDREDG